MSWKFFFSYYGFLLLILVSWTNVYALPPLMLRLLFMTAVIIPLCINRSKMFSVVFLTFIVISAVSFAVSYMPVDGLYILITLFICFLFFRTAKIYPLSIPLGLKLLCIEAIIVDLFYSGEVLVAYNWLCLIVIAYFFLDTRESKIVHFMAFSFVLISFVLSLEFILVGDKFISDVHTVLGDLDRKGWTDPNYFGSVIGMGIVAAIIELMINPKIGKKSKCFICLSILLSLYTLVSTASRGATVALILSSIILLTLSPIKKTYKLVGGVSFIIVLTIMYASHMLDLLILRFQSDAGDAGGRTNIWIARLDAFMTQCSEFEWLFGVGKERAMVLGTGRYLGFHNDYLGVLVMYGFVGFIFLLSLLMYPIIRANTNRWIVFAAITYVSICMFTIEPFIGGQWGCLYFYLFCLVLAQVFHEKKL